MPGTGTLIMRDPKRAGNLPSDFFTREREAGAKFPSKKVSLAGAGAGSRYTRKKLHSKSSLTGRSGSEQTNERD